MTIFLSFFKLLHFKLVNDCEKKRVMHNKKLLLTQLTTLGTRDGLIKGLKSKFEVSFRQVKLKWKIRLI